MASGQSLSSVDWEQVWQKGVFRSLTCSRHPTARWVTLNPWRKIHRVFEGYPHCTCKVPDYQVLPERWDYERAYRW